jgi:hypothetical protein
MKLTFFYNHFSNDFELFLKTVLARLEKDQVLISFDENNVMRGLRNIWCSKLVKPRGIHSPLIKLKSTLNSFLYILVLFPKKKSLI